MRKSRDAFLGKIGRAVPIPLVDDGSEVVLLRLGGDGAYQLVREPDIELDEIDLLVGERGDDAGNLILRCDRDGERRPYRVRAIDQWAHAVNAGTQHAAGAHLSAKLQYERRHVAGIHHGGDPGIEQRVQVLLVPQNVEADAIRSTEQVNVHVGEAGQGGLAPALDPLGARRYAHVGARTHRFDTSVVDHDDAALDRG